VKQEFQYTIELMRLFYDRIIKIIKRAINTIKKLNARQL